MQNSNNQGKANYHPQKCLIFLFGPLITQVSLNCCKSVLCYGKNAYIPHVFSS